jgi:acyl-CoA thioester hydrolase
VEAPTQPDPTPDMTQASFYRYWIDEAVRFADLDPVGHANNAAISVYFESARVALFIDAGSSPISGPRSVVVARVAIDFRAELNYGEPIRVGLKVTRFGRSSLTLHGGIFRGDTCIATSEVIGVIIDTALRKSVEIDGQVRAKLTELAG